jgi:predicted homoserine dehydrogenase-like protein
LAKGAKLLSDVKRDDIITYDMVEMNHNSVLLQLRRIQDQTMG